MMHISFQQSGRVSTWAGSFPHWTLSPCTGKQNVRISARPKRRISHCYQSLHSRLRPLTWIWVPCWPVLLPAAKRHGKSAWFFHRALKGKQTDQSTPKTWPPRRNRTSKQTVGLRSNWSYLLPFKFYMKLLLMFPGTAERIGWLVFPTRTE